MTRGGFNAYNQWTSQEDGYWGKVDAIAIIVARFYIIMFIISIVISIISLFAVNRMAKAIEKEKYTR